MVRVRQASQAGVTAAVFGFFLCFFLLVSSGRIGSYDAGQQLSAATVVATRHTVGVPYAPVPDYWGRAPNGLYYEPHDLGAILLMLPAAVAGSHLDHRPADSQILNPPLPSKVAVSLTYAVVCAVGCFFLFRLFALRYSATSAFLIAFVFAFCTYYLAYAKVAWDVAPTAAAMCGLLYYAQRMLEPGARARAFVATGLWLAIVCTFRYSMAPGFVVALAFLWWATRGPLRRYLLLAATFAVGMVPTFIYNAMRTGMFLRPANTSPYELSHGNAMNGDIVQGFFGLLFGDNRGLLLYSPIVLLCLMLPWIWRKLPSRYRALIVAMSLGMLLYMLILSKLTKWGAFGWGARYLVPCLPVIFLAVGPCLLELLKRSWGVAAAIVVAAALYNAAPATTNWHVIVSEYPGAGLMTPNQPYAIEGIWDGFWRGLHGEPLIYPHSDPQFAKNDPGRRFPDFWTARLMERSTTAGAAGWAIVLVLLTSMTFALRKILRNEQEPDEQTGTQELDATPGGGRLRAQ